MGVVVVVEIRGYFSAVAVFVFASMIFAESPLLERVLGAVLVVTKDCVSLRFRTSRVQ